MKKIVLGFALFLVGLSAFSQGSKKIHKVGRGETLYSISRSYGIKVTELVQANSFLKKNSQVKVGQKLVIPGSNNVTVAAKTPVKIHSVASTPDTPYSDEDHNARAKAHSEESMALATSTNEVPVIEKPKPPVAEATPVSLRTNSSNAAEYPAIFGQYFAHGYKSTRMRGAANYLADNTSGNQYLAFYNGAESGSIIKVTNMMNKKVVYVKVVGKVPPADASKEVILKLSHKAAHELGAIDEKFLVEVLGCTTN